MKAAIKANELGLGINAGHDLSLENIKFFKDNIPGLLEVSIGHALISESLYLGCRRAAVPPSSRRLLGRKHPRKRRPIRHRRHGSFYPDRWLSDGDVVTVGETTWQAPNLLRVAVRIFYVQQEVSLPTLPNTIVMVKQFSWDLVFGKTVA